MSDRGRSDHVTVSDAITGVGFFGTVLLGFVFPFAVGIGVTYRLLPFGGVRSWVHGWRGVLGTIVIFLLWFFGTYITDALVDVLFSMSSHKVLKKLVSEVVSFVFLMGLIALAFSRWEAMALSSLITEVLTILISLLVIHAVDAADKHD